ncbi:MAG: hypothetical protein Kow0092_28270 [Deferrisomatales bacterium]
MTIHLGRKASREGWVSFETDPRLARTKERLYERCLPCLTALYEQLKEGAGSIELTYAWECWKVVALTRTYDECLEVLDRFQDAYPGEYVYGKIGKGGGGHETFAVIFHTEGESRRDELHRMLSDVVRRWFPGRRVFVSRACGDPYERLLGPWPTWRRVCPAPDPATARQVRAKLRESLYGRS